MSALGLGCAKNAKTLNRDRRNYSSKTALVAQLASEFKAPRQAPGLASTATVAARHAAGLGAPSPYPSRGKRCLGEIAVTASQNGGSTPSGDDVRAHPQSSPAFEETVGLAEDYCRSSSIAFAALRTGLSKPSVNQP